MRHRHNLRQNTQTRAALAADVWRACDILRRDDHCGGVLAYVEHLAWLLFLRFLDAQETRWETQPHPVPLAPATCTCGDKCRWVTSAGDSATLRDADAKPAYAPALEDDLRWRAWARADRPAEELLPFVHERLIPALQALSGSPMRETIRGIFSERHVVVAASAHNLKDVLAIVDRIDFHSQDDIFTVSQVYEELLQRLGGENRVAGEFYTPRPVIRFIVELVAPRMGETVYDPACGSCGFLVQAYQQMLAQAGPRLTGAQQAFLDKQTLYGQEKKALPALLGLMNLVLHGVSAPNVRRCNTLEEGLQHVEKHYDVILTNPPFGGTENRQTQHNFPVRASATELLFLQHIMEKLAPRDGARCGMVVPEGLLFRGGAFATVKQELLQRHNLHTVISLPPGTFAPYSDVKTALLFFERPGPTREIWTYDLPLPAELKKFSKGNPLQDTHFDEARELWAAWEAYRGGHDPGGRERACASPNAWILSADAIADRDYDLTARTPRRRKTRANHPPDRLAAALLEQAGESRDLLQALLVSLQVRGRELEALPQGWEWKRLAEPEVAQILMGQSPPGNTYNDAGEGLPFFQGKADFGELYPVPRQWCSAPVKIAQPGDVLISVRAPVGPTNLCAERCCIGRGLAALRPGPQMVPKFLLFVLRGLEPEIARRGQGSTFAGITRRDLAHLQVPLPPLDEQRRMVAYLDAVQAQVTRLKRLQAESAAELARLQGAILAQIFGDE